MAYKSTRIIADLKLVLIITLSWMFLGVCFTFYDFITTSDNLFYSRSEHYSFLAHLSGNLSGSFLGGVFGGSFIVFYSNKKLRNKTFLTYVFLNSFIIITMIFLINLVITQFVMLVYFDSPLFDERVLKYMSRAWKSLQMARGLVIWFVVSMLTTFLIRVNEKYGPGVLRDVIIGKYHKPRNEERIFMFLDIKSSTAIAESLGNFRYFSFLKEFYADITDPIIYNRGAIYQYVGDEVVISWKVKHGIMSNNCLKCFFEARQAIEDRSEKYQKRFFLNPEFKAGLHIGMATVGEIGVMKKEIAFSGDVLNTTSRIQDECNKYGAELLISKDLLDMLDLKDQFVSNHIGGIELKGKRDKVSIYSVEMNTN